MSRILLLLPSASYRAEDFLDAAAALDAEVVVASEYRQTLSSVMGPRALRLDLRRPEPAAQAIVDHADGAPLDAIVAVDDQGVAVAALAAERLGLPHNPPAAVAATRDKSLLRARLEAAGINQPRYRVAHPGDDLAALVAEVGPPCVCKPVSLSASRGVIRVDDPAEAPAVGERIRSILATARQDPGGPLLVEEFVPGREVAVEALLRAGTLEVLAVFDKPDPLDGPYFEETIYTTPSRLPAEVQTRLQNTVTAAAAALGLREGPVHAEARITEGGVALLEIAARTIGGLCSRALRFGAGVSLEQVIIRHALGMGLEGLFPDLQASGVMMLPIRSAGRLNVVRGMEEARRVPGIVGLEITIRPGRPVVPLPEGDRYLGFLFARGAQPADVERALRAAHARLDVVIDPDPAPAAGHESDVDAACR